MASACRQASRQSESSSRVFSGVAQACGGAKPVPLRCAAPAGLQVRDSLGLTYDVSFELSLFDRLPSGWFHVNVTSTPQVGGAGAWLWVPSALGA